MVTPFGSSSEVGGSHTSSGTRISGAIQDHSKNLFLPMSNEELIAAEPERLSTYSEMPMYTAARPDQVKFEIIEKRRENFKILGRGSLRKIMADPYTSRAKYAACCVGMFFSYFASFITVGIAGRVMGAVAASISYKTLEIQGPIVKKELKQRHATSRLEKLDETLTRTPSAGKNSAGIYDNGAQISNELNETDKEEIADGIKGILDQIRAGDYQELMNSQIFANMENHEVRLREMFRSKEVRKILSQSMDDLPNA